MELKTTMRYYFTPTIMGAIMKKTDSNKWCWGYGEMGILRHFLVEQNIAVTLESNMKIP